MFIFLNFSCKKLESVNNSNPPQNNPTVKLDTVSIIQTTIDEIKRNLNDAFRLKFVTNRIRGEFSVINPSAWQGSFTLNTNVSKAELVFPSYYKISFDSISSPFSITSFADHHSRYEYRVLNSKDTNRLEYVWVERNLNNHPIDTMIYRMYQNNPYNWEKEYGIYLNSNIKVPYQVLTNLSPKWNELAKLKGYDMIERWVTSSATPTQAPNAVYKYKNFETCFYQNLSDSLVYFFKNSNQIDFSHKLNGFWLIEYPNFKRQVAFKINHQVFNGQKFIERNDSLIIVNTANTFIASYNFGALESEAGVSRYNIYDQNKNLEKYIIIDRGEWAGKKSTEETIKYVDLVNKITFIIRRPF